MNSWHGLQLCMLKYKNISLVSLWRLSPTVVATPPVPLLLSFAFYKKRRELFTAILNKKIAISCVLAGFFGYYLATLSDFHSLKLIDANINRIILYTFPAYVLILNSIVERRLPGSRDVFFFALVQIGLFFVSGKVFWNYSKDFLPKRQAEDYFCVFSGFSA